MDIGRLGATIAAINGLNPERRDPRNDEADACYRSLWPVDRPDSLAAPITAAIWLGLTALVITIGLVAGEAPATKVALAPAPSDITD